jgi:hypothetical protein
MAIHYLGDNGPDGTVLGTSTTEKIGFYGLATAIVQPSVTYPTATATTTTNEAAIVSVVTALVNLGLIVTT